MSEQTAQAARDEQSSVGQSAETVPFGAGMGADIDEQPEVFARLVDQQGTAIEKVAATLSARKPKYVLYAARGTSDHAALYGAYLTEIRLGIPAALASPSAITVYGARPNLSDALVIGVSQSGGRRRR